MDGAEDDLLIGRAFDGRLAFGGKWPGGGGLDRGIVERRRGSGHEAVDERRLARFQPQGERGLGGGAGGGGGQLSVELPVIVVEGRRAVDQHTPKRLERHRPPLLQRRVQILDDLRHRSAIRSNKTKTSGKEGEKGRVETNGVS